MAFFEANNPGFKYKYADSSKKIKKQLSGNESTVKGTGSKYRWDFVAWSECSKKCGGGIMTSYPSCIEEGHGVVAKYHCCGVTPPMGKILPCNLQPCSYK